jgi:hypothetical protein
MMSAVGLAAWVLVVTDAKLLRGGWIGGGRWTIVTGLFQRIK